MPDIKSQIADLLWDLKTGNFLRILPDIDNYLWYDKLYGNNSQTVQSFINVLDDVKHLQFIKAIFELHQLQAQLNPENGASSTLFDENANFISQNNTNMPDIKSQIEDILQDMKTGNFLRFEPDIVNYIWYDQLYGNNSQEVQKWINVLNDFKYLQFIKGLFQLHQLQAQLNSESSASSIETTLFNQNTNFNLENHKNLPLNQSKFCCSILTTDPNYKNPCKQGQINICL